MKNEINTLKAEAAGNSASQNHPSVSLHKLSFSTTSIHACITLCTPNAPENGNLALHVCKNQADVMQNRLALASETLSLDRWCLANQKHTGNVVRVTSADAKKGAYEPETAIGQTDGLYTTDPNLLIGVFTADCLGILFYDEKHPLVGAVHSGWKGTVQAIVANFLTALKQDGLLYPESLHVVFSPSLMPCSLEVGPEVVAMMEEMARKQNIPLDGCILTGQGDRSFLDHQKINCRLMEKFQIPKENIQLSVLDTKTNLNCFSYRRDGKDCGEHFSCIWIDAPKK